jgi:hypothetical protein
MGREDVHCRDYGEGDEDLESAFDRAALNRLPDGDGEEKVKAA